MGFDPMPPDEIQAYLGLIGNTAQAVSVILTDGTMVTGRYTIGDQSYPLILQAAEAPVAYSVAIPGGRIAGILEQNPVGAKASDPSLLVLPARHAGLDVVSTEFSTYLLPGGTWQQTGTSRYRENTMLYLDANAISARSGGLNNIGGGWVVSAQIGWERKLVGRAEGRLKHHVAEVGAHCAAPRADLTLIGYVEFFDISGIAASSEGGPLLQLEGSLWSAAKVWRAPPGPRNVDGRWALCYFRQECMSLGPRNWERIGQPVRVYGDKQPHEQTLGDQGIAHCYLMARAAACFPSDKLCPHLPGLPPHSVDTFQGDPGPPPSPIRGLR
jgi:hypothetical protein